MQIVSLFHPESSLWIAWHPSIDLYTPYLIHQFNTMRPKNPLWFPKNYIFVHPSAQSISRLEHLRGQMHSIHGVCARPRYPEVTDTTWVVKSSRRWRQQGESKTIRIQLDKWDGSCRNLEERVAPTTEGRKSSQGRDRWAKYGSTQRRCVLP